MRMTTALFALALFAIFLSLSGDYESAAGLILFELKGLDATQWATLLIFSAVLARGVSIISSFLGFSARSIITAPAVSFLASLLAAPIGVFNQAGIPTPVRLLVIGFWLFFMISGVGAAVRGDF